MLSITPSITLPDSDIEVFSIRAQGSGGQNVNKVSTAIHLRFDIQASSLPPLYKQGLLKLKDQRINKQGIIIIKAQQFRSREKNYQDALTRLVELIRGAGVVKKSRRPTRPSKGSQTRRLNSKAKHGQTKILRRRVDIE